MLTTIMKRKTNLVVHHETTCEFRRSIDEWSRHSETIGRRGGHKHFVGAPLLPVRCVAHAAMERTLDGELRTPTTNATSGGGHGMTEDAH